MLKAKLTYKQQQESNIPTDISYIKNYKCIFCKEYCINLINQREYCITVYLKDVKINIEDPSINFIDLYSCYNCINKYDLYNTWINTKILFKVFNDFGNIDNIIFCIQYIDKVD